MNPIQPQSSHGSLGDGLTRRRFVTGAASTALLAGAGMLTGGCEGTTTSPLLVRRSSSLSRTRRGGLVSLEEVVARRRSEREFTNQAVTEAEISQLLWAAQGITADWGGRTSPSAGALYPLELYLVTRSTYGHYRPQGHRLEVLADRDLRGEVAAAARDQPAVRHAPLTIVISAVYARTVKKYGSRGRRYAELEAGHVAQNVLLQAVALGLVAVPIGAFDDQRLAATLRLPSDRSPLYIIALGHPGGITTS